MFAATLSLALWSAFAGAAAPMAGTNAPAFSRMMLGAFEVTVLGDGTVDLPVDQLLSEKPETTKRTLAAAHLTTPLETSVNAYLINTGSKLVLIDTGAGAFFGPTLGKLLANLKAAGYEAGQVDEIYLTHMHPDHLGGLVSNNSAVFPNAVVRADQRDAAYWLSEERLAQAPAAAKGFFQNAKTALGPYVAAGRFAPFSGEQTLLPGVRATTSYGHTPGHISYLLESEGKKLLLVGDLIHVAAVQLDKPGVTIAFDVDAKAAAATRGKAFGQAAREGTLVGASHLQFPGLGRLRADGEGFRWLPVNYTQLR
jgi:glyoxylase-like metal-dependent hydrolase (beta-lactamase superfamily II)